MRQLQPLVASTMRLFMLGLALGLASGCYRYTPSPAAELSPGVEIRAHLSDSGAEQIRGEVGPEIRRIDGRLVRWNEDGAVAMAISRRTSVAGYPSTTHTQTLELSPAHIEAIEERELDHLRTAGLVGALVTGTVVAVLGTMTVGGGPDDSDEGGRDDESRPGVWMWFP